MKQINVIINGVSPILMHSDKLSDPLDPSTVTHKQLTSKRKKTEEDHLAIARSEFVASAYFDGKYFLPGHMFKACFINAAKLNKLGTTFKRAVLVLENECYLNTPVSEVAPEDLFDNREYRDARTVVVSSARLMRYRPRFNTWSTQLTIVYDDSQVDDAALATVLGNAGSLIGVGDYRVEKGGGFGRFTVEVR